ncbi:MAG: ABC transporter permease [Bdellovibrionaceae bacterium]|nr:ABC transporter permease [Pseudobdellovibrionaceae bacterium]MDW8190521.1 ABC transporter permease [Pseudobdellovibrionaceae bacterium]
MLRYIFFRLLQTVVVIVALSFFCYLLLNLMPGDPVEILIQSNPKMTPEDIQRLRELYGLDRSIWEKYSAWIGDILKGDLGYSRTYRVPVSEILLPRLGNTFILSLSALLLSLFIAIPLGILAALRVNTKVDYLIGLFSFGGISTPSFWLGLMLIIIFGVQLKWFPASGTYSIENPDNWLGRIPYLVLPTLTLSYLSVGRFIRFTRSSMLEALKNDYIRTAIAKGLPRTKVIWKHAFRNALLSLITMVTLSFSGVFSGATITETVFAYQGVGKLVYDSILGNDFNVAMVSFMISVSMVLLFSLIADLLYSLADPRIRLH